MYGKSVQGKTLPSVLSRAQFFAILTNLPFLIFYFILFYYYYYFFFFFGGGGGVAFSQYALHRDVTLLLNLRMKNAVRKPQRKNYGLE